MRPSRTSAHTTAAVHAKQPRPSVSPQQPAREAEQTIYPTPPTTPDLIDSAVVLDASPVSPVTLTTPAGSSYSATTAPLPIHFQLDTPHTHPHASGLRLTPDFSILGALGGTRILDLNKQSLWDRMPHPVIAASVVADRSNGQKGEEEHVERMLGGKAEKKKMST